MKTVASIWRKRAAQPVLGVFFGLVLVMQTAAPTATVFAQAAPDSNSVVTEEQAPAPEEQPLVEEEKTEGEQEGFASNLRINPKVDICHKEGNGSFHEIEISFFAVLAHVLHGDIYPVPQNGCPSDDEETGNLTLIKEVVGGQGEGSASLWTLTADGEETNLSGTTPVSGEVNVGDYDLSESGGLEGYTASAWVCELDTDSVNVPAQMVDGDTVTVSEGQTVICTITNTFNTPDPEVPNLHFIKVVCDQYSDIVGNPSASVEDDTNGNYTQFQDGVVTKPISPTEIPGKEDGCYRADGWSFLLSTDIGQESNTQIVGPTTGGEYVTPVTGEGSVLNGALQDGIQNGSFWVSEEEQKGYGFATIRCYNDALNGDNLEFVNLGEISPNTPSNIYCIAYNVELGPDPEPCGTELVANGGFEVPAINQSWDIVDNNTPGLAWFVQWMPAVPGGAPTPASVEFHRGVNGWLPQEGQQHAELDGDWGGPSSGQSGEDGSTKIYQHLPTVSGNEYTISFWTSPRPGIADNKIQFSWDGTVEDTIIENGSTNGQTVWTQHTYTLEADGPITTIEFADLSVGDSLGSFIDNVSVVEECGEPCVSGPSWATSVVDYDQGLRKDGSPITNPDRTDPAKALNAADWVSGTGTNFYALGFGGTIELSFTGYVVNTAGDDLSIHEATNGTYPNETVSIEVSQDGTNWFMLSEAGTNTSPAGVTYVDFNETGLDWIQYVRLTDTSIPGSFPNDADGFDLDAVDATQEDCTPPVDPCNQIEVDDNPSILTKIVALFVDDSNDYPNEEDCTSSISGMKYNDLDGSGTKDEGEPGLAGWDIYAYKGIPASNITVDSANINGSNTNDVAAGQYLVMARGTWNNGGSQYFDTEFHTPDSWATHEDGVVPYGTDLGDLIINNGSGDMFVDWGVYNDQNENGFEHYYFYILNHPGGNINYSVFDGEAGVKNPGWYGDNTGSINVQMYPLLDTAVTDVNGNYILEFETTSDFPVVVREVQQNGWTQTSPNASDVPAATPVSDGVNYPITGNWNWAFVAGSRDVTGSDFGNHYVGQEDEDSCEEIKYETRQQLTEIESDDQYRQCSISGYKYEDVDGDGDLDEGELALAGWTIYIDEDGNNLLDDGEAYDITDSDGYYSFNNLPAGSYTIREENQSGWSSTYPSTVDADNEYDVNLVYSSVTGRDFYNEPQDEPCTEVPQEVSLISGASTQTAGYTTTVLASDADGLNATNYSGGGSFTNSTAIVPPHPAWVDPATDGSFTGSGAVWISTDAQHPGEDGGEGIASDNQWRLFQTTFTVPAGATITPGTLYFSADNAVSVYLNGIFIDDTSEDLVTYGPNVAIPEVFKKVYSVALNPVVGSNTLSFVLRNSGVQDLQVNPTALLYAADFSYTPDCDVPDDGGSDGDGGGSRSSGSGGSRTPRVLGDSDVAGIPYQAPQVLGAQLPRTGSPMEVFLLLGFLAMLAATPVLARKSA